MDRCFVYGRQTNRGAGRVVWVVGLLVLAACSRVQQAALVEPQNGADIIARMHDAYRGHWYTTLTFVQRTTFIRPNGTMDSSLWHESLKGADRLRIDFGPLSDGNGALFTADSTITIRGGQVSRRVGRGNPFLPLVQGVYLQPAEATERQLAPFGFAMDRLYRGEYDGRPVWVVGATSPADTTSTQFWVDSERWVLLRMILAPPQPGAPTTDARVSRYVRVGDSAWLGTYIAIITGQQQQLEEYTNWRVNVELPDELFDPARWMTATHWGKTNNTR